MKLRTRIISTSTAAILTLASLISIGSTSIAAATGTDHLAVHTASSHTAH